MGIAAIVYIAFYLLTLALVGAVILACVPRFRATGSNISWFICGAILGWVATVLPMGGVGMVALKMKFAENRTENEVDK